MYADPLPPTSASLPRLRPWLVPRERLAQRLTTATDVGLALLVAPAGYGKTTLLAQAAAADARPCAWVTLTAHDDDPAHLIGSIARGLRGLEPPLLLVLDDAHLLHAPAALGVLRLLAGQIAHGSLLALAARREPALGLGRMRAEGGAIELGAAELAMDEREGAELLRRAGLELDDAQAAALVQRTEGWPAGLRLAARTLCGHGDPAAAVDGFAGDDRLVADYVREQLLTGLAPWELAFLLRIAPLDVLSGELCDAVLGCSGSGRVLRKLSRSNLPLVPLDRAERRFRHHRLLAETLRGELRRVDPCWEQEAHRRACRWHERHGELPAAIDHAVAAGDARRAGSLLWRALPDHAFGADDARLAGWLDRLGEQRVAATPALALGDAASRLMAGRLDAVERLVETAEQGLGDEPAKLRGALAAAAALVRATLAHTGAAAMRADAERAESLSIEDPSWRALACLLAGVAHHMQGERAEARERLERGMRGAEAAAPLLETLCRAQLVLLALDEDDVPRAAALARRAHERIDAAGIADRPICALAFAATAFANAQAGQVAQARRDGACAQRLREQLAGIAPWYDAQLCFALARTELRLSRAAEARALLAEASHARRLLPDAVVLIDWMDDAWARADAFAASAVRGPSMLTIAELRVLRLLPSHFSFREIAARLHVSANTVKTQAHAVYRKLDVSSRSEAVARARAVGLVEG